VCGGALKEVGLSLPGNVFELRNSSTQAGWLINLKAAEDFSLPAVEMLALRLFMTRRISQELKIPIASVRLIVSFNGESKKLPFPAAMVNKQWLQTRIGLAVRQSKVAAANATVRTDANGVHAKAAAGPSAVSVQNFKSVNTPNGTDGSTNKPPKTKSAEQLLDDLHRQFEEEDVNVTESGVFDGSLSDFQRAYA
jgi:hypothetical protein